ncbi:MAG: aminotransferase class III-fold pyridoxal phosphate-dependent enzyme, partial [Clostridiales bacterium]|nr:aminotransferase class III-fold pyridoxal phosphate-dependent enzyme [Clostridiales bacterium]
NIGIVHPDQGYHDALRELTKKYGTLLIIDETHTMCCGPGGYTQANSLKPDMLTVGKAVASGIPSAVYGMSEEVASKVTGMIEKELCDTGGIGGSLAGNALTMAAMRATLSIILTPEAYAKTIPLAARFNEGVQSVINEFGLPWNTTQLGCRTEYWFRREPSRNGSDAASSADFELDQYMHLATLNRGILMTPFHNMALIAVQTTEADIDRHTAVFREITANIID